MRRLVVEPEGWPCTIKECPAGLFMCGDELCLKTAYSAMETVGPTNIPGADVRWVVGTYSDVYCWGGSGFSGGETEKDKVEEIVVQPVVARWEDY